MSLRDVHGGRALVLRLVLAELVAKQGTGPLAPRVVPRAERARPGYAQQNEQTDLQRAAVSDPDKEPA